jgi:glycosyltransferase involved in cell wall biosynthesis
MIPNPLVSVILPVYNRHSYLSIAINSVLNQNYLNWELIIADDASEINTQNFLDQYVDIPKIKVLKNSRNLGLFANLNQAIKQANGSYIVLLCSDDFLLPHCLNTSVKLMTDYDDVNLILTAFNTVDQNGGRMPSASVYYHNLMISSNLEKLEPCQSLRFITWGSINGNLTGMCFRCDLFDKIGGFKENWTHAGDWEWVYRACQAGNILISKIPIANIRIHDEQLSGVNFKSISNSLEVIEMVNILLRDNDISELNQSRSWALHILQFHLWFAFKLLLQGQYKKSLQIIQAIDKVVALPSVFLVLLKWLPSRWKVFWTKEFALPVD